MITEREKELLKDWLIFNLQTVTKSNIQIIIDHVDRYFESPSEDDKRFTLQDMQDFGIYLMDGDYIHTITNRKELVEYVRKLSSDFISVKSKI